MGLVLRADTAAHARRVRRHDRRRAAASAVARHHEHERCGRGARAARHVPAARRRGPAADPDQRDGVASGRRRRRRAAAGPPAPFGSAADRHGEVLRRRRPERRDRRAQRAVSTRRHARRPARSSTTNCSALAREAHDAGWRIATHAIGDAAIDQVLRVYEACGRGPLRHRIEHFGLPTADHLARAARAGVIAAPQAVFVHALGRNFRHYLPDALLARAYPVRAMLDAGVTVALSSDAPVVEDDSPLRGMQAAVLRRDADGEAIAPAEAISIDEALDAYTQGRRRRLRRRRGSRAPAARACRRTSRCCRATRGPRRPRR